MTCIEVHIELYSDLKLHIIYIYFFLIKINLSNSIITCIIDILFYTVYFILFILKLISLFNNTEKKTLIK